MLKSDVTVCLLTLVYIRHVEVGYGRWCYRSPTRLGARDRRWLPLGSVRLGNNAWHGIGGRACGRSLWLQLLLQGNWCWWLKHMSSQRWSWVGRALVCGGDGVWSLYGVGVLWLRAWQAVGWVRPVGPCRRGCRGWYWEGGWGRGGVTASAAAAATSFLQWTLEQTVTQKLQL